MALGARFEGYEIHGGETTGPDTARPLAQMDNGRLDGAISADGLISGGYVTASWVWRNSGGTWLARLGATGGGVDHAVLSMPHSTRSPRCWRSTSTSTAL